MWDANKATYRGKSTLKKCNIRGKCETPLKTKISKLSPKKTEEKNLKTKWKPMKQKTETQQRKSLKQKAGSLTSM